MKLRLELILGALLLAVVGPFRFHYLAQADGFLPAIARRFLAHRWVVKPARYHAEFLADRERDSITDYAVRTYSGEDLGGWGGDPAAR